MLVHRKSTLDEGRDTGSILDTFETRRSVIDPYDTVVKSGDFSFARSTFEIEVTWADVEKFIEKFCEIGRSEALAFREGRKLAKAAEAAGWHPPQSK